MEYSENFTAISDYFENIIDHLTDDIGSELINQSMTLNKTEEFLARAQSTVHQLADAREALEELYSD